MSPAAGWGDADVGAGWTVQPGGTDFALGGLVRLRITANVGAYLAALRRANRTLQRWRLRAAFRRKARLRGGVRP